MHQALYIALLAKGIVHPIDPNADPHNYGYSYLYWNSSQYPGFDGCISPQYLNFSLLKPKNTSITMKIAEVEGR